MADYYELLKRHDRIKGEDESEMRVKTRVKARVKTRVKTRVKLRLRWWLRVPQKQFQNLKYTQHNV